MIKNLINRRKNERGASAVEYALIVAAVAGVILALPALNLVMKVVYLQQAPPCTNVPQPEICSTPSH